jgi:hypothetical protein
MGIQRHPERRETTSGYSTRSLWLLIVNDALVSCMRLIGPLNSDWRQKRPWTVLFVASSSGTQHHPLVCRLDGDHIVRVEDEFLGSTLVKVLIALGGILKRNDGGVHRLGDLYLVM